MYPLVVMILALLVTGCASSSSTPAPPSGPQTTTISVPPSGALGGSGSTVVLSVHRDARGSRHTITASPEQVWAALLLVYEKLQIPVGTIDSNARRLGNTALVANRALAGERVSRSLNCGESGFGAPVADSHQVTVSVLTLLEPVPGGGTLIETRLTGSAIARGVSTAPVHCSTSGRLEERIAQGIQAWLGS